MARKNTKLYLSALVEDDKMLQRWADARTERHLWVEASIRLEASWYARRAEDFAAVSLQRRTASLKKARTRIRRDLAEICLMRDGLHMVAIQFFAQVAPSLAKKIQMLRRRLTTISNTSGRGGQAHAQMIQASKTLQTDILSKEQVGLHMDLQEGLPCS